MLAVPPEPGAVLETARERRRLALVPATPARLRVADVALFYGERSGGIRTYIDAKAAWARDSAAIEHHVIVPGKGDPAAAPTGGAGTRGREGTIARGGAGAGAAAAGDAWRHELPSLRLAATNGYRVPIGVGALRATLRALRPDVVLLHDPFWGPLKVARTAHRLGARVVAVHHGSIALGAAGLPGPDRAWYPLLRAWMHHAYGEADAVISAVDPREDTGRAAAIDLRFGLDPAFVPHPDVERADHVLYVGRLGREKGVIELLHAAARSHEPWRLRLHGRGPIELRLRRLAENLGLGGRVQWRPYISDRAELARAYAAARVVVMPGAHETFGLVGFEAAASGACVVTCATAPSAARIGDLARTYEPGDIDGLLTAIEAQRAAEPDHAAAAALAARSTWAAAFEAETAQLARLARR
jgi:alpha-1,6-mannosyltransferase